MLFRSTLIGTCAVPAGDQTWTTLVTGLRGTISGVTDVFLVFKGGTGNLFKLNWIRFTGQADGGTPDGDGGGADSGGSGKGDASGCNCILEAGSIPAGAPIPFLVMTMIVFRLRRRPGRAGPPLRL